MKLKEYNALYFYKKYYSGDEKISELLTTLLEKTEVYNTEVRYILYHNIWDKVYYSVFEMLMLNIRDSIKETTKK